ncbi:hypothetical protein Pelo_848 [Pelomyxa schiedti]|nr:hypothetical protein Pelo_848 [Pelomyxa schiedti]
MPARIVTTITSAPAVFVNWCIIRVTSSPNLLSVYLPLLSCKRALKLTQDLLTSDDALKILPFHKSDLEDVLKIEVNSFSEPFEANYFHNALRGNNVAIYTVKKLNVVNGYIALQREKEYTLLTKVAVREACRGAGVGSALIAFAIHMTRQWHLAKIMLQCRGTNRPAISLFLRLGFQTTEWLWNYDLEGDGLEMACDVNCKEASDGVDYWRVVLQNLPLARQLSVKIGGRDNKGACTGWEGSDFCFAGWALSFTVDEYDNVCGTCHNDVPSAPTKTLSGTYNRRNGAIDITAKFSSSECHTVRYTGLLARGKLCVVDMHKSRKNGQARGIVVIEEKEPTGRLAPPAVRKLYGYDAKVEREKVLGSASIVEVGRTTDPAPSSTPLAEDGVGGDQGGFGTCTMWGVMGALCQLLSLDYNIQCELATLTSTVIAIGFDAATDFVHLIEELNSRMGAKKLQFSGKDKGGVVLMTFKIRYTLVNSADQMRQLQYPTYEPVVDKVPIVGGIVVGQRTTPTGQHGSHLVHAAYWLRKPTSTIECINSWGASDRFLRVPGSIYPSFLESAVLTVDEVQVRRSSDGSWSAAPPTQLRKGNFKELAGLYTKDATTVRGEQHLLVEANGRVFSYEGTPGSWMFNDNISFCDGLCYFEGWMLDTSLSTLQQLLWRSTPTAIAQGNSRDPNEVVTWTHRSWEDNLNGTYLRSSTGTRGCRKLQVSNNLVTIEEGTDWSDGGRIEYGRDKKITFKGWVLDKDLSNSSALHWFSTKDSVVMGSSLHVGEHAVWTRLM